MRSALVTGGAGFIGSHVADALLADGWSVTILDNFSTGRHENVPSQAEVAEESIASPAAALLVRSKPFDLVAHCAAQMDVRRSVIDPLYDATTNIVGTVNLLEAVRASGRKPRFIFTSTGGAVYGEFNTPPNVETFPKDPESPYAVSKLSGEYYAAYYTRVQGVDAVVLRLANVYGPRQDPHGEAGVVAIFCSRIRAKEPLTVYGTGEQTRDYVYVGDVVRAIQAAAAHELPAPGRLDVRAYNVGTGTETTVNELARILQSAAKSNLPVKYEPERRGEQFRSAVSTDKARAELGWHATVPLDEGLAATWKWFAGRS